MAAPAQRRVGSSKRVTGFALCLSDRGFFHRLLVLGVVLLSEFPQHCSKFSSFQHLVLRLHLEPIFYSGFSQ